MGLFQRLIKGASEPGDSQSDRREGRSPDQARASVDNLSEELRALKKEIKLLRESLADSGGRVADKAQSQGDSRRSRRRGRGRDKETTGRDAERPQERRSLPKTPPDDAPTGPLVDYLKTRDVTVFEGSDDLNRNEAFEHLARHLGTHFEVLAPFYEKMKRCVATGRGQRIDIDHFSDQERSAAVQFGTLLHRHGMLKDFYYHRSPKKQLRVIPTKDGQTGQFLTGGWLEIYVSLQLWRRLKAHFSPAKFQMLYNVKGTLPDGREFESDLMAAVEGRFFWLECKTGNWQDYAARFKGLVKVFGVDRESAALLLIRPPDQSTRQRATDMLDMTLLSLTEVDAFISRFLGVEGEDPGQEDDEGTLPVGVIPPLSEDEIPLENAEPARKLGKVNLGGGASSEGDGDGDGESSGGRRRKRRRRGGRGRNRNRDAEGQKQDGGSGDDRRSGDGQGKSGDDSAKADANGKSGKAGESAAEERRRRSLSEPLPIERLEDEEAKAEVPPEMVADIGNSQAETADTQDGDARADGSDDDASGEDGGPKRKRSRGRRGGRGRRKSGGDAEGAEDSGDSDGEDSDTRDSGKEAASGGKSEEDGDGERPRRRRKRTRKASPFAVDEDAAEAAEAAEAGEPAKAEAPSAEPASEESASEEVEPQPEQKREPEPEPEPEPEQAAEPEPEEEEEPAPRTSPTGTVIAPDLAAMMAGSKKKADDE